MPLTEAQRRALPELRAVFSSVEVPFDSAMSFNKRARLPTTGIPDDITARVEIAPPLSTLFPLRQQCIKETGARTDLLLFTSQPEPH